ncbi:hypothetical protein [Spirosoma foliorum]|uniref:Uncharacterized protein n=1 Tax=Spirosoma foliorum TaxID=2710596 RepID=A0A7G5GU11_9BACT|nr:hypothetical protein [Spirosoma foliorum]QMW02353.1 hypothetical protein H3H32_31290 [Spirosoma foliorum]
MKHPEISQSDYLKLAISYLLDLIERANASIERHRQIQPRNELAIEGFVRVREQYVEQLNQLMATFDLSVNSHAQAA